ncbi:Fc.00g060100.m01.CDS01 [Cosmosporella sp. VM-42]
MSQRRTTEFEERDYYAAPRRSAPELDEVDYRRRTVTISPPPRSRVSEGDRTPAFLRDEPRRSEAGPMVLRQRQVETIDRHRPRSPSPVARVREERIIRRPRSVSPSIHDHEHERSRTRITERERIREPSVPRKRSPSPRVIRYVERPRRSPSPPVEERERIRTRIIEREREKAPSPSPSPPPPPKPQFIKGPTIEREVITHYRDIDHGVIQARPPTPPPQPAPRARSRARSRAMERETDIDISLSKNKTEVDIRRSVSRARSKSRERRSHFHDDELVIRRETDRLKFDDQPTRRRAHSAAPMPTSVDQEAEYITSKVDSRGRMGEAWGGATKDWTIVDVPPGTERVRMDGIGGGSTDTAWTKYSGVRRTQFIPERDGAPSPSPAPKEPSPPPRERDRLSVSVYDREREIDIEKVTDRRVSRPNPSPAPKDMWTEITKDLVCREAIEEMGYDYEETQQFFYIMDYLKYDDVLHLVDISDEIRRARKHRAREIEYEREYRDDWERSRHRHHGGAPKWDEVVEREVVYDSSRPSRGYLR